MNEVDLRAAEQNTTLQHAPCIIWPAARLSVSGENEPGRRKILIVRTLLFQQQNWVQEGGRRKRKNKDRNRNRNLDQGFWDSYKWKVLGAVMASVIVGIWAFYRF